MLRPALALVALLALPTAHAADLDLKVTSDEIGPVAVTLHNVKPGSLPSVDLPGPDGHSLRVDLTLADSTIDGAPAYELILVVTKRTPTGRKKIREEVSRPTLRFKPDQDAEVIMGSEAVACTANAQYRYWVDYFRINVRISSDTPAL